MGYGIKRRINSVLSKYGYMIVSIKQVRLRLSFFAALKYCNYQPKLIYDVGANHGFWTRDAASYFPHASYILFEPQDQLKSDIEDLTKSGVNIEWINAGVGSEPGVQWFTISHRDDSSSFAARAINENRNVKQIKMEITTLNEVVARHSGAIPDLVKIDAEGWDLQVLKGASNLIGTTDIFLIEAGVCARDGENTFVAVVKKFDELGYSLVDITDLNRSPRSGLLWLTELAFLRRGSPLLDLSTSYE